MVITFLEAHVTSDRWQVLEQTYKEATLRLDRGIVETFLLQNPKDTALWRILTIWESRTALDEMRNSLETPRGVLIFRAAGAEPVLSVFDVAARANPSGKG